MQSAVQQQRDRKLWDPATKLVEQRGKKSILVKKYIQFIKRGSKVTLI
jgi:hypothetical protein